MRVIKLYRNIRLGVKTLLLHKLRSFLTMLGVVFGVSSVVAMLAVGEGASKEALEQIRKLGSTNIIISSVKPAEEESDGVRSPFSVVMFGLLYDDERRARETFEAIERTVPVKIVRQEGRLRERTLDLRVIGTSADWFQRADEITIRLLSPICLSLLSPSKVPRMTSGPKAIPLRQASRTTRMQDAFNSVTSVRNVLNEI